MSQEILNEQEAAQVLERFEHRRELTPDTGWRPGLKKLNNKASSEPGKVHVSAAMLNTLRSVFFQNDFP